MMLKDPPLEKRTPPDSKSLRASARANPGGWVYDIDFEYPPNETVPPEAIRGAWEVSATGTLTGGYKRNTRYRPIQQSHRTLKPYMHAGAKHNPGVWVAEIDPSGEHLFPDVPANLIRGWWLVDKDGRITSSFRKNSLFAAAPGTPG